MIRHVVRQQKHSELNTNSASKKIKAPLKPRCQTRGLGEIKSLEVKPKYCPYFDEHKIADGQKEGAAVIGSLLPH